MRENAPLARAHAYHLLAELLEWGPSKATRQQAAMSPILAEAIADHDPDELSAAHTAAFGMEVFPYAGVFLDPSAQAGAGADSLHAAYLAIGFDPDTSAPGVDHLSTLLRALAHASARQADSRRHPASAEDFAGQTQDLLDTHLLRWLPAWVSAVRRLEMAWPCALAEQIMALVRFHRSEFGACRVEEKALAPLPDLEAKETDLRTIALALTAPAVSGVFLSRHDIASLARRSRTPTGFGSRCVLLENALTSAAQYDTLTEIIEGMRAIYRCWEKELRETLLPGVPGFEGLISPWQQRASEASVLLGRIGVAARNAAA